MRTRYRLLALKLLALKLLVSIFPKVYLFLPLEKTGHHLMAAFFSESLYPRVILESPSSATPAEVGLITRTVALIVRRPINILVPHIAVVPMIGMT